MKNSPDLSLIRQVSKTPDPAEANALLALGWRLLAIHQGKFVLGREKIQRTTPARLLRDARIEGLTRSESRKLVRASDARRS